MMTGRNIENLASYHPRANNPVEPYCGVAALFNGDLQTILHLTDRADWEVVSAYEIKYKPALSSNEGANFEDERGEDCYKLVEGEVADEDKK